MISFNKKRAETKSITRIKELTNGISPEKWTEIGSPAKARSSLSPANKEEMWN